MYKNIGLFFLAVAQMQLLEYFIWSDQGCGYINNNASKMIVPVLNLQALAMILGSYIFDITILSKSLMSNITIFVVLFEVITSILYLYITRKELVCSLPIKNKGIEWNIGQSNIIGSDVIHNILCLVDMTQSQFIMVSVIEDVHEIAIEGMDVIKFRKLFNNT